MTGLVVDVPGRVTGQGSKKGFATKTGKVVMVEMSKKHLVPWRASVAEALKRARLASTDWHAYGTAYSVLVTFRFPRPKHHYQRNGLLRGDAPHYYSGFPDVDKCLRAVLDAAKQAEVFQDDRHVVIAYGVKVYADNGTVPGAQIVITEMGVGL